MQLTNFIDFTVNRMRGKIREDQKITMETKKLCDLILTMVECTQKYMRDVDGFARHGKHDGKQELALQVIDGQENPDFHLLSEYIGQLRQCLNKVEWSYEEFCHANRNTKSVLDELLKDLKTVKEDDARAKKDTNNLLGGLGVLGTVGGAAAAVGFGLATGGIGPIAIAGLASAVLGAKVAHAHAASSFADDFRKRKKAYLSLAEHTSVIQTKASNMQQMVVEINKSLEDISTNVDTIYDPATGYDSLPKCVFSKMDELGQVSSDCCKRLELLESDLKSAVSQLTVQTRQI